MRRLILAVLALASAACIRDPVPDDGYDAGPSRPPVDDYDLTGRNCGTVTANDDGYLPRRAIDCLQEAVSVGGVAHLVTISQPTVEGQRSFTAYQTKGKSFFRIRDERWGTGPADTVVRQRCRVGEEPGFAALRAEDGTRFTYGDCTPPD